MSGEPNRVPSGKFHVLRLVLLESLGDSALVRSPNLKGYLKTGLGARDSGLIGKRCHLRAKLVYDPCLGSLGTFQFRRTLGTGRPRSCLCSPGNLRSHRMQCTCAVHGVPSDSRFLVAGERLLLLRFEVGNNSVRDGVAHLNRMATNFTVFRIRLVSHR